MNDGATLLALAAMAHPTRLDAFRRLVQHELGGLSAGQLIVQSGVTRSTFSTQPRRARKGGPRSIGQAGRQFIQRADIDGLRGLMLLPREGLLQGVPSSPNSCWPNSPAADRSKAGVRRQRQWHRFEVVI